MSNPDPIQTRAHWDALASGYDEAKARNDVYYRALKETFDEWVEPAARGRVLDIGCGTGQILAHLHPEHGVGIDASEAMIERATARHADRADLAFQVVDAADAADLGAFDAVISADLLEHVPDWAAVVDAAVDACRPEGTIALTTPNPAWALPLWILETARLKMPEGPHAFVGAGRIAQRLVERGCRLRHVGTHLLLPARLGGLGPWLSDLAARLPFLRRLGVIQLVVATAPPAETDS